MTVTFATDPLRHATMLGIADRLDPVMVDVGLRPVDLNSPADGYKDGRSWGYHLSLAASEAADHGKAAALHRAWAKTGPTRASRRQHRSEARYHERARRSWLVEQRRLQVAAGLRRS